MCSYANGKLATHFWICSHLFLLRHPLEKVTRTRHNESTSNLVQHTDNCDPKGSAAARNIATFAHAYNPGRFRLTAALWIAHQHRPFAIIEDPELIELFTSLNNKVVIPSCFTVSRDIQEIFATSQVGVAALLQVR